MFLKYAEFGKVLNHFYSGDYSIITSLSELHLQTKNRSVKMPNVFFEKQGKLTVIEEFMRTKLCFLLKAELCAFEEEQL